MHMFLYYNLNYFYSSHFPACHSVDAAVLEHLNELHCIVDYCCRCEYYLTLATSVTALMLAC